MKINRILKSRKSWHQKACVRGAIIRKQSRKIRALEKQNQNLKTQLENKTMETLAAQKQLLPVTAPETPKNEVRAMCVALFVVGVVPCNAVRRLLQFLMGCGKMSEGWIPDSSSIVNWIGRAGLGSLSQVCPYDQPWLALIDTSIALGKVKALIVLRVPLSIMSLGRAPTLADVECIGVKIGELWNGDTVLEALEDIFKYSGYPTLFLKDGGSDLMRGVSLLISTKKKIKVLQDIGHVVANLLKAQYATSKVFLKFIELISSANNKLRQTEFSSLCPPKLRKKGRFQSVSRLIIWADRMLKLMNTDHQGQNEGVVKKIKDVLPRLAWMFLFIRGFKNNCILLNQFQDILKSEGLNQESYKKAKHILEQLPKRSLIRKKLMLWLKKHMNIQCQLGIGQTPLLVSSDIIETLMGKLKLILERMPISEFTTMTLAAPLLCGERSLQRLQELIETCPHKMLTTWRTKNCERTHRKQRQHFLQKIKEFLGPKTEHVQLL